jgi:hypothetical protein
MNVSKMPGFNAEASLGERAHYRLEPVTDNRDNLGGSVQPAMQILRGSLGYCVFTEIGAWCCRYGGGCFDLND